MAEPGDRRPARFRRGSGSVTLQVAVIGIDGSGKSTLASSLAVVIAAERRLIAGSAAADQFWIRAPEMDLAGHGFHPGGYAIAARLNVLFRRLSHMVVDHKALYPAAKVLQMLLQDNAAVKLSRRYHVDVMVSDGNLLLSGAGRAFNYRGPAENPPSTDDIDRAFKHLLEGTRLGPERRGHLPDLTNADALAFTAWLTRMRGVWGPERVFFLDVTPERTVRRLYQPDHR